MKKLLLVALLLTGCGEPAWKHALKERCAGWMQRAKTSSDTLNVEMNCASIYASNRAADEAAAASGMSAASMGASFGANASRR